MGKPRNRWFTGGCELAHPSNDIGFLSGVSFAMHPARTFGNCGASWSPKLAVSVRGVVLRFFNCTLAGTS
jgi:hypothetical protein